MEADRAAEAVNNTLGRLYKCHGYLVAPGDPDLKSAMMEGFIKASKELVVQVSNRLSIGDLPADHTLI